MLSVKALVQSIALLFVILDPIGNAPVFYSLTADIEDWKRSRVVRISVAVAALILLCFLVLGELLLSLFNVGLDDLKIAGGIVLFIMAVQGILGKLEAEKISAEEVAVVPIATPLLAGPGAITTIMYLSRALGYVYALISLVVNVALSYVVLSRSSSLFRLLGRNGSLALSRIMAMLLAAIAVSMIKDGLLDVISSL